MEFFDKSKLFSDGKFALGNSPSIWFEFSLMIKIFGNIDLKKGKIFIILLEDKSISVKLPESNEHSV